MNIQRNILKEKLDVLLSEIKVDILSQLDKIESDVRDINIGKIEINIQRSSNGIVFNDSIKTTNSGIKLTNRKRYVESKLVRNVSDKVFFKEYIGKKVFLLNKNGNVECSILTDKNIGGFGLGLYGYFYTSRDSFVSSLKDFNEHNQRTFFLESDICDYMNISKDELYDKVRESREYFASRDYESEKELGLFVEL